MPLVPGSHPFVSFPYRFPRPTTAPSLHPSALGQTAYRGVGISSTSRLHRGLGCLALATSHKQLPRHAFGTHHRPWLFSFGLTHGPCDTRSSTACLAMCSLMIAAHGALHLFPSGETKVLPEPRGDRYLVVAPETKNSAACITQPTYLRPTAHSALQLYR